MNRFIDDNLISFLPDSFCNKNNDEWYKLKLAVKTISGKVIRQIMKKFRISYLLV